MRRTLLMATTALLLVAGAASAQTTTTPPQPPTSPAPGGAMTPVPPPRAPAVNPLTMEDISKVTGTAVYGSDDKKLGSISTELVRPDDHKIDRLVVASGGVLGIGGHYVALPIDSFTWDAERGAFHIAKTADELKGMPAWRSPSVASVPTPGKPAGAGTDE